MAEQPNPQPQPNAQGQNAQNPPNQPQPPKRKASVWERIFVDLSVGGLSAAFAKTLSAPLERVKLLMQHEAWLLANGKISRRYNGFLDCLVTTVREEGFLSLWRGNLWNVLRYFPTQLLNLALKDTFNQLIPSNKSDSYAKKLTRSILTGTLAGANSLLFVYPLDTLRTIEAIDTNRNRMFPSVLDVIRKSWNDSYGLTLYGGFSNSVIGILLYRASYFGLYDLCKASQTAWKIPSNVFINWSIGYLTTIAAGLITYPIDTLRRLEMTYALQHGKFDTLTVITDLLDKDGPLGFQKGAFSNVVRGVAGAFSLVVFDEVQSAIFAARPAGGGGNA